MQNTVLRLQLLESLIKARSVLSALTPDQQQELEKSWDVEHAYYSNALEGSKITRAQFDRLAKLID